MAHRIVPIISAALTQTGHWSDRAHGCYTELSSAPGNRLALKPELLREPNHHERKSNQKEEDARACAVVLRSHSRTAVSLLARPSGPSAWRHLLGMRRRTEPN